MRGGENAVVVDEGMLATGKVIGGGENAEVVGLLDCTGDPEVVMF